MVGAGAGGDSARVVCVDEAAIGALAAFYSEAWGEPVSPETVRRNRAAAAEANPAAPGRVPPAFLFMAEGRPVGHLGTIPVRLRLAGTESPAHWLKGLMVLPERQNGPVGFFLLREATRECATAMALVVELAARRLYTAHGFADLGALPNGMKLLAPAHVLERLDLAAIGLPLPPWVVRLAGVARWPPMAAAGGALLAAATGLWTAVRGGGIGSRGGEGVAELPSRADLDRLWDRIRDAIPAAVVRDGAYLERRYGGRRARDYLAVPVFDASRALAALAIVRRPRASGDRRLNGIRVAVLADLLYSPAVPALGLAALAGAEKAARAAGADALLATATDERVRALLRRRAYLDLPGNVHFMARVPDAGGDALPRLGEWWLTRGDSEADEVF
jgi:GNAT superfamily N-acetyltransferase